MACDMSHVCVHAQRHSGACALPAPVPLWLIPFLLPHPRLRCFVSIQWRELLRMMLQAALTYKCAHADALIAG